MDHAPDNWETIERPVAPALTACWAVTVSYALQGIEAPATECVTAGQKERLLVSAIEVGVANITVRKWDGSRGL